jgi:hypothetical protein
MEPDFRWDYRKVSRILNQVNDGLERLLWAMDRAETLMRRYGRSSPETWFGIPQPYEAEAPRSKLLPNGPDNGGLFFGSGRSASARKAGIRRRSGFSRNKRKV